jgi:hypothetical protein
MELADAINARFVETTMKELMREELVSLKKRKQMQNERLK